MIFSTRVLKRRSSALGVEDFGTQLLYVVWKKDPFMCWDFK